MRIKRKNTQLKKWVVVLLLFIVAFATYVEIINRNSKQMTYRQKVLKTVYPALMWFSKLAGKKGNQLTGYHQPAVSFYSLQGILNNGERLDFSLLKGKKILLVNTASDCGYTNQYEDLQKLSAEYKEGLVVLGFPSNDFKEQEKRNDAEIAEFCKINFGVSFPLMKKSSVIKSPEQNSVFQWLTDPAKNGWNKKQPAWNFSKYLVNEEGILINYFGPAISPVSTEVRKAITGK